MLTYATLTHEHIPIERLQPGDWSLFCRMQDDFDKVWEVLSDDSPNSFAEKAQEIKEFANASENTLGWASKGRIVYWPGGDPLPKIRHDMIQRLVLCYEHSVADLKQEALKQVIEQTVSKFPEQAERIREWFQKHQGISSPNDLISLRIDASDDWSRSGMPKNILITLRTFAQEKVKEVPDPCPEYPRSIANLREATVHLVEDLGGQLAVARETGLDQGNLSNHIRSFSKTPLNAILETFELAVNFRFLRPQTERQGLKGESWELFQEIVPSYYEVLHYRFAIRVLLWQAALSALDMSPFFWEQTAEIETRFLYPMIPSGIRSDFLVPFKRFVDELRQSGMLHFLGKWLIDSRKIAFLKIENVPKGITTAQVAPMLLLLSASSLPAQIEDNSQRENGPSLFSIGEREVFVIAPPRERESNVRAKEEWEEMIKGWPEEEQDLGKLHHLEPPQLRLLAALSLRWWRALWSEGLLPPDTHRWQSFYQFLSQQKEFGKVKLSFPN